MSTSNTEPAKKTTVKDMATVEGKTRAQAVANCQGGIWGAHAGQLLAAQLFKTPEGDPTMGTLSDWKEAHQLITAELNAGNMAHLIGRLNGHLAALDVLFSRFMWLAGSTDSIHQIQAMATLALKVQGNMRATAQTISDLKHPRQQVNFVRADTANVSSGPQQNNITHTAAPNQTNKLNEERRNGDALDA